MAIFGDNNGKRTQRIEEKTDGRRKRLKEVTELREKEESNKRRAEALKNLKHPRGWFRVAVVLTGLWLIASILTIPLGHTLTAKILFVLVGCLWLFLGIAVVARHFSDHYGEQGKSFRIGDLPKLPRRVWNYIKDGFKDGNSKDDDGRRR